MKQAWTVDAGLTWTDTMQERHDRGDLFARTAIRAQSSYTAWDGSPNSGKFAPELATAVRESADSSLASLGLDEAAAKATGYWALTKKMVDDVVDALPTGQAARATQQTISIVCACCILPATLPATYCLPLNLYPPPARRCCSLATHRGRRAHNMPRCTSPRAAAPSTPQSRLRPRAARARRGSCVRLSPPLQISGIILYPRTYSTTHPPSHSRSPCAAPYTHNPYPYQSCPPPPLHIAYLHHHSHPCPNLCPHSNPHPNPSILTLSLP